jgi:hypothetical protein
MWNAYFPPVMECLVGQLFLSIPAAVTVYTSMPVQPLYKCHCHMLHSWAILVVSLFLFDFWLLSFIAFILLLHFLLALCTFTRDPIAIPDSGSWWTDSWTPGLLNPMVKRHSLPHFRWFFACHASHGDSTTLRTFWPRLLVPTLILICNSDCSNCDSNDDL